jgi:cyclophilin family peptidyl-prolyl cis-trans isomerase
VKAFYAFFIVIMIASMAAVGFSTGGATKPEPAPLFDITATPVVTAAPVSFASPAPVIDGNDPYIATLKTNKGDIEITFATDTPQTINSFAFLAAKRFYDGAAVFYLDHEFWAQAGDPDCRSDSTLTCTGSRDAGYELPREGSALKHVKWAVVAPATQGVDTVSAGQFRILLMESDARLDGRETVFGTVTGGQDVLEQAAGFQLCTALTQAVPDCQHDLANAIVIEKVTVSPAS